jgi:hypothetical protein
VRPRVVCVIDPGSHIAHSDTAGITEGYFALGIG